MTSLRYYAALGASLPFLLISTTVAAQPVVPKSLSVGSMFMDADWVVKLVMIGLLVASLITWTVAIAKGLELGKEGKRQLALNAKVIGARSLADARKAAPEASDLLDAAALELTLSADALDDPDGIRERIATRFARLEAETGRKLARGIHVLATIGATAPFVGLFGTVWGIMNAFIGISEMQTTNLAVVAPGIAEALLATGVGLFAAIPAVVIYNHFARKVAEQRALAADRAAAILNIASRDLSRGVAAKDL
ncbi:MAG: tonB-system energizer ExbB [Sphingomonadales bacterium 32-64-17]|nr:MAG: tonB-system energizer ExbB [Sphingomonadales bacterium 32-64-17]